MARTPGSLIKGMSKRTDFLTWWAELDEAPRIALEDRAEKLRYPAGSIVVQQGDSSDSMFVVMEGALKVFLESPDGKLDRTLGYLGVGDLFGELGLLYNEPRSATVRSSEEVKLVRISREGFEFLMKEHADFARFLVFHLADRFKVMMQNISHISYCTQLRGNLPAFELLAVFQTIAGSGRKGVLSIRGAGHERTGLFYFEKGTLVRAKYNHLVGQEAVWQVAVDSELPASFDFEEGDLLDELQDEKCSVDLMLNDLLMEAAMKKDLGSKLERDVETKNGFLLRKAAELKWEGENHHREAERLWASLTDSPRPTEDVWVDSGLSIIAFSEALLPLVENRIVEWRKN